jgi:hypothetical protein
MAECVRLLDGRLTAALAETARRLSSAEIPLSKLREKHLSATFAECARTHFVQTVAERRTVKLDHFPRVGGADIAGSRQNGELVFLAELKWSYGTPDKIFEAAWDAVKLALAREQLGLKATWLITGAAVTSWTATECADLFTDGDVRVRDLWDRAIKPRSPNQGSTIGDDCEIGGRGLMFSHAPEAVRVRLIAQEQIVRTDEVWELRAADVRGLDVPVPFERRVDPQTLGTVGSRHVVGADFPKRVTRRWLERNVPHLPEAEFQRLLQTLRQRNYTEDELNRLVHPLRKPSVP